jgi:hypothetical protein
VTYDNNVNKLEHDILFFSRLYEINCIHRRQWLPPFVHVLNHCKRVVKTEVVHLYVMVAVVRDCSKKILKKKHYFQGIPRLYNFEGTNAKNIKDVIFRLKNW